MRFCRILSYPVESGINFFTTYLRYLGSAFLLRLLASNAMYFSSA